MLLVSNLLVPPAIAVFIVVGGAVGGVALAVIGAAVVGTFGVTMVMGQEYMPQHIGMASGLVIGLSIGLGGIAAVFLGAVADAVDLETTLWLCAARPDHGRGADAAAAADRVAPCARTGSRLAVIYARRDLDWR